jgi:putative tributyrin esterase
MNKYRRVLLTLALIVFTCSLNAHTKDKASAHALAAHTQVARIQQNPRVQTIQFESKLAGKTLPYNVLLPVSYNQPAAKATHYPVLYLLHGLSGHYTNWIEKTKLVDYSASYEFIIVMPEGNDGWYTDSPTVPGDKYESYILQELIPDVEKRFRAGSDGGSRAIAGLSMGGYGAIKFGLKHPEMFAFAASLSGAFSAASWEVKEPGVIRDSLLQAFGPANSETRAANDLPKLAREAKAKNISLPFFYIDCGTEDHLFSDNREFISLLLELKIPHEYRQLPGGHSWTYWDTQVQEVLRIAAKRLRPSV